MDTSAADKNERHNQRRNFMKLWKKLTAAVLMSAAMLGAGLTAKPCLFTPAGTEITAQAAEKVTVGDLTFTKVYRDEEDSYAAVSLCSKTAETVVIPAEIDGLPVAAIGDCAFYGCTGLTSITIGNSVTHIYDDAFQLCTSLKNITLPNSVTYIGISAFKGCTGLTSITIGNRTYISNGAFSGCSGLKSITIGNSVAAIGDCAFSGCSGLKSITIPGSVTSLGAGAFYGCSGLTSINKEYGGEKGLPW